MRSHDMLTCVSGRSGGAILTVQSGVESRTQLPSIEVKHWSKRNLWVLWECSLGCGLRVFNINQETWCHFSPCFQKIAMPNRVVYCHRVGLIFRLVGNPTSEIANCKQNKHRKTVSNVGFITIHFSRTCSIKRCCPVWPYVSPVFKILLEITAAEIFRNKVDD